MRSLGIGFTTISIAQYKRFNYHRVLISMTVYANLVPFFNEFIVSAL
jgi:hypothetical protein